ncbi:GGDEF domain-containing protein [Thiomicrorhabdus aquaedulcis]|uniref:GGDEF domain-containing protein n=1 Tax=Thiomicrorhabdus aquaedulcis TaxID=2211106 RepID=UPI000FDB7941|nr:GGDEF domain-containing protein [Thiomicrorhabdus aquaedulcis]
MAQHTPFKKLFIKQMLMAIGVAFSVSFLLISVPAYWVLQQSIKTEIEQLNHLGYAAIKAHLTTGWKTDNLNKVYQQLHQTLPNAGFYLQKAPAYLSPNDSQVEPTNPDTALHFALIKTVERNLKPIIDIQLLNGSVHAALPIVFRADCLVCHGKEVAQKTMTQGGLAGTLVFHAPLSINRISSTSLLAFFALFFALFVSMAAWVTNRLIQNQFLVPLSHLSARISRLRLSTHQQSIDWARTPQSITEIDAIDKDITEHLQTIQGIYSKLDALVVTEHETGLFHKERFNEVLKYELFRSHRFQQAFSLMVVKLLQVKPLNGAARALQQQQPGVTYQTFGHMLQQHIRQTDLAFRLDEHLFAIIAPNTQQQGAQQWQAHFSEFILHQAASQSVKNGSTDLAAFKFTVSIGIASHDETEANLTDSQGAKALMMDALNQLKHATPLTLTLVAKTL